MALQKRCHTLASQKPSPSSGWSPTSTETAQRRNRRGQDERQRHRRLVRPDVLAALVDNDDVIVLASTGNVTDMVVDLTSGSGSQRAGIAPIDRPVALILLGGLRELTALLVEDGRGLVEVTFRATNDMGDHVTGTAVVDLPLGDAS